MCLTIVLVTRVAQAEAWFDRPVDVLCQYQNAQAAQPQLVWFWNDWAQGEGQAGTAAHAVTPIDSKLLIQDLSTAARDGARLAPEQGVGVLPLKDPALNVGNAQASVVPRKLDADKLKALDLKNLQNCFLVPQSMRLAKLQMLLRESVSTKGLSWKCAIPEFTESEKFSDGIVFAKNNYKFGALELSGAEIEVCRDWFRRQENLDRKIQRPDFSVPSRKVRKSTKAPPRDIH